MLIRGRSDSCTDLPSPKGEDAILQQNATMGTFLWKFTFSDVFIRKIIVTIILNKQNLWDVTIRQLSVHDCPLKLFCGNS